MSVPKLRFKEFSGDFEKNKLVEYTKWSSGGTPSKDNDEYWNGDIPLISGASMHTQKFFESDVNITELGLKKGSKLAPKDSILILVRGSMLFNKIPMGLTLKDVAFNQDVKCIQPTQSLNSSFLFQWFLAKENIIQNKVTSTGIGAGKLDTADLQNLEIVVPKLEEQTKIASFLSAVDEKISQLTQKHELLSQYKQGMMQKLFSQQIRFKVEDGSEFGEWEETTLGNLYQIGSSKRVLQEDWKSEGIPFLRTREIISLIEKTKFSSPIFITEELYVNLITKYGSIKENDILVSGVGTVGKAYVVKATDKFYFKDGNVIWLSHKGLNNSKFIYYFFQSPIMENYFIANKSVTTVDTFTIEQAKKVVLFNPCLEEQTKIANFLSNIDQKIEVVAQQIEQAKQWKKGLLQQMFV